MNFSQYNIMKKLPISPDGSGILFIPFFTDKKIQRTAGNSSLKTIC